MKKLLFLLSVLSLSSYAQVVDTRWQYGNQVCRAQTVCLNGRVISCQTVALNYGNFVGNNINALCRTRVVPGQFIHCQGYSDRPNVFGQVSFIPTNLPVSCF